uniref:Uncharacterized protein n=1 Tax=Populus trichocarpa TaxID=3694 RepID=A0A2K2ANZ7_POPTR
MAHVSWLLSLAPTMHTVTKPRPHGILWPYTEKGHKPEGGKEKRTQTPEEKIKGQRTKKNREFRPENQRRKKTERTGESIRPRTKHTQTRRNKHRGEKPENTEEHKTEGDRESRRTDR